MKTLDLSEWEPLALQMDPFDRVLVVSRESNPTKAPKDLAGWIARALAELGPKAGGLIVQLDELLPGLSPVAIRGLEPQGPIAACLTGSPKLIASMRSGIAATSKGRAMLLAAGPASLGIVALVSGSRVVLDADREFRAHVARLAAGAWTVEMLRSEEFDIAAGLIGLELTACADREPAPWAELMPEMPAAQPGKVTRRIPARTAIPAARKRDAFKRMRETAARVRKLSQKRKKTSRDS